MALIFVGTTKTKNGQTRYVYYNPEYNITVNLSHPIENYDYAQAEPPREEIVEKYKRDIAIFKGAIDRGDHYEIQLEKRSNQYVEKQANEALFKAKLLIETQKRDRFVSDTGFVAVNKRVPVKSEKNTNVQEEDDLSGKSHSLGDKTKEEQLFRGMDAYYRGIYKTREFLGLNNDQSLFEQNKSDFLIGTQTMSFEELQRNKQAENWIFSPTQFVIESFGIENTPYTGDSRATWAVKETGKDIVQGAIGFFMLPIEIPILLTQAPKIWINRKAIKEGFIQSFYSGELFGEVAGGLLAGGAFSALISSSRVNNVIQAKNVNINKGGPRLPPWEKVFSGPEPTQKLIIDPQKGYMLIQKGTKSIEVYSKGGITEWLLKEGDKVVHSGWYARDATGKLSFFKIRRGAAIIPQTILVEKAKQDINVATQLMKRGVQKISISTAVIGAGATLSPMFQRIRFKEDEDNLIIGIIPEIKDIQEQEVTSSIIQGRQGKEQIRSTYKVEPSIYEINKNMFKLSSKKEKILINKPEQRIKQEQEIIEKTRTIQETNIPQMILSKQSMKKELISQKVALIASASVLLTRLAKTRVRRKPRFPKGEVAILGFYDSAWWKKSKRLNKNKIFVLPKFKPSTILPSPKKSRRGKRGLF